MIDAAFFMRRLWDFADCRGILLAMPVFEAETLIHRSLDEIYPFFADARNLEHLTPPWLKFRVLTEGPIEMQEGALIDYRLRVHGLPLRWRTLIEVWEPPYRFVDRQIRGPYRKWVHEHRFEETEDGVRMFDHVDYAVPGGWLIDRLFVRRDIERIFQWRTRAIQDLFSSSG